MSKQGPFTEKLNSRFLVIVIFKTQWRVSSILCLFWLILVSGYLLAFIYPLQSWQKFSLEIWITVWQTSNWSHINNCTSNYLIFIALSSLRPLKLIVEINNPSVAVRTIHYRWYLSCEPSEQGGSLHSNWSRCIPITGDVHWHIWDRICWGIPVRYFNDFTVTCLDVNLLKLKIKILTALTLFETRFYESRSPNNLHVPTIQNTRL